MKKIMMAIIYFLMALTIVAGAAGAGLAFGVLLIMGWPWIWICWIIISMALAAMIHKVIKGDNNA